MTGERRFSELTEAERTEVLRQMEKAAAEGYTVLPISPPPYFVRVYDHGVSKARQGLSHRSRPEG